MKWIFFLLVFSLLSSCEKKEVSHRPLGSSLVQTPVKIYPLKVDGQLRTAWADPQKPHCVWTAASGLNRALELSLLSEKRLTLLKLNQALGVAQLKAYQNPDLDVAFLSQEEILAGQEIWIQSYWGLSQAVIQRVDHSRIWIDRPLTQDALGAVVWTWDQAWKIVGTVVRVQPQALAISRDVDLQSQSFALVQAIEDWKSQRPWFHQTLMAKAIHGHEPWNQIQELSWIYPLREELLDRIQDLWLQTSWKEHFQGSHRFRYKLMFWNGQAWVNIYTGPWQNFQLENDRQGYVHREILRVPLAHWGHYVLTVETDGRISDAYLFDVVPWGSFFESPKPLLTSSPLPFFRKPVQTWLITAKKISHWKIHSTFDQWLPLSYPFEWEFDVWIHWAGLQGKHQSELFLWERDQGVIWKKSLAWEAEGFYADQIEHLSLSIESSGRYWLGVNTDGFLTHLKSIDLN